MNIQGVPAEFECVHKLAFVFFNKKNKNLAKVEWLACTISLVFCSYLKMSKIVETLLWLL